MALKRFGMSLVLLLPLLAGCGHDHKPYGEESRLFLPGARRLVWAITPTVNLSGQSQVDPLLQSDLVYAEMQQTHGLTVIPVNRVAEIFASLRIEKIQSEKQAEEVCRLLGCDGLVVPTVTAFDPYDPPKFAGALQLFLRPGSFNHIAPLNPRDLERSATVKSLPTIAETKNMVQVVNFYDASDGSVRQRANEYAVGRSDPNGPLADREIYASMDRYCGFCYHELITQLLDDLELADSAQQASSRIESGGNTPGALTWTR